jgi:hypothetical protein
MSTSATAAKRPPSSAPAGEPLDLDACLAIGRRDRDRVGLMQAGELYGEDLAAELAAIKEGTHPLQKRVERRRRAR